MGRRSQLTLVPSCVGEPARTVVLLPGVASDVKNTESGGAWQRQRS